CSAAVRDRAGRPGEWRPGTGHVPRCGAPRRGRACGSSPREPRSHQADPPAGMVVDEAAVLVEDIMPIYQTAHYQVTAESVERVKAAIDEFVQYVRDNEPGTRLYAAWQQQSEPTRFVHLFIFEDEDAHHRHGESAAVRAFEAVYSPELVAG